MNLLPHSSIEGSIDMEYDQELLTYHFFFYLNEVFVLKKPKWHYIDHFLANPKVLYISHWFFM